MRVHLANILFGELYNPIYGRNLVERVSLSGPDECVRLVTFLKCIKDESDERKEDRKLMKSFFAN